MRLNIKSMLIGIISCACIFVIMGQTRGMNKNKPQTMLLIYEEQGVGYNVQKDSQLYDYSDCSKPVDGCGKILGFQGKAEFRSIETMNNDGWQLIDIEMEGFTTNLLFVKND